MSGRFYALWGLMIAGALIVPIAIPYALWPPREGAHHGDIVAECGRRAENDASRETPFVWLPLSSHVQSCERDVEGVLSYSATVHARGPYGIPYGSAEVTQTGFESLDEDGVLFALLALATGVVVVSLPFTLIWLRHTLAGRLQLAA